MRVILPFVSSLEITNSRSGRVSQGGVGYDEV